MRTPTRTQTCDVRPCDTHVGNRVYGPHGVAVQVTGPPGNVLGYVQVTWGAGDTAVLQVVLSGLTSSNPTPLLDEPPEAWTNAYGWARKFVNELSTINPEGN